MEEEDHLQGMEKRIGGGVMGMNEVGWAQMINWLVPGRFENEVEATASLRIFGALALSLFLNTILPGHILSVIASAHHRSAQVWCVCFGSLLVSWRISRYLEVILTGRILGVIAQV